MTTRSYAQYCGLAYALDLVGERWALLVVRDLLHGPRRFTDLARGLQGIPSNVLSARLRELEENGIVARRVLPRPDGSVVYELTPYGRELEEIVLALGRWGARSLGPVREGDALAPSALLVALQASFQPEAARALRAGYELRIGPMAVHAVVEDGALTLGDGPLADPDLVLETDETLVGLLNGELTAEQALADGRLAVRGDAEQLPGFFAAFRLPSRVRPSVDECA